MPALRCGCGHTFEVDADLTSQPTTCPECGRTLGGLSSWTRGAGQSPAPLFDKTKEEQKAVVTLRPERRGAAREWLYITLGAALLPLAFHTLKPTEADPVERLEVALNDADPAVIERVNQVLADPDAPLERLLAVLPGNRLDANALLPRETMQHYAFGVIAGVCFAAFIGVCFPVERGSLWPLLLIGAFTGTLGILLLLGVQWAAINATNMRVRVHGKGAIIVFLLMLIGWSYRAALDPEMGWLESFGGYTFGVGLCEEVCKALPVIWLVTAGTDRGWRGLARVGLASGAGFGISEAIFYASNQYNGVASAEIYWVRYASCVALHAVWAGAAAVSMWRQHARHEGPAELPWLGVLVKAVAIPMVLHGIYNTCLKRDMQIYATAAAVASYAWLIWQVESARRAEALEMEELAPGDPFLA